MAIEALQIALIILREIIPICWHGYMSYSLLVEINFSETRDWREGFKSDLANTVWITAHGSVDLFHLTLHNLITLSQQESVWIVLYSCRISEDEIQVYKELVN